MLGSADFSALSSITGLLSFPVCEMGTMMAMLEVCLEDQMRQCSCKEKSVLPIRIPLRKVELCLLRKFFARSKNQAPWGRRWVGRFQQDKERILLAAPGRKWGARRGRKPCGPNGTLPVMPASLHQNLK